MTVVCNFYIIVHGMDSVRTLFRGSGRNEFLFCDDIDRRVQSTPSEAISCQHDEINLFKFFDNTNTWYLQYKHVHGRLAL